MRRDPMHAPASQSARNVYWETAGANDGSRTRDIQDHNLALYQLSYVRHSRRGVYGVQPAAVNRAVPGCAWKCRASRATASSSSVSCLQNAKRA